MSQSNEDNIFSETDLLEEEYCAENQSILVKIILKYVLTLDCNLQYNYLDKSNEDVIPFNFDLDEIIRCAIDMNDKASYYCLQTAYDYAHDIVGNDIEKIKKNAVESLINMFKDFKILNKGSNFSCSTNFILTDNSINNKKIKANNDN